MSRIVPIISIVLLFLVILGGVFLWWPKYEEFTNLKQELAIKTEELQQKQEFFNKLNELAQKLEGYKEQLAKIGTALPEELLIPDLYNYILKTVSENGLILKNIKGEKDVVAQTGYEAVQKFSFSLSLAGSYEAFKNFLSVIYQNARLIEVDSIKFGSSQGKTNIFDFSVGLSTYYEPRTQIKEQTPGTP